MLYSSLKLNRNFGGTCRPHLQSRRISEVRNQLAADSKQSKLKKEATYSSPTPLGLHRDISQKIEVLFIKL
jgi:hypothetical protein